MRPRTPTLRTLRALASDLIIEIRRLDRRITTTATEITAAVTASGSTLTQLHGIGNLLAGKILARVDSLDRFRSAAASASYTGTAPLRRLKRQLSNTVYRHLVRDAHPNLETDPGGHQEATTTSSTAGSSPTTDSSDKSLPEPADTDPTNPTPRSS